MPSEMSILGIMVRNAELMALLSIYKSNVNMNENSLEKCAVFHTLLKMSIKGIRVRYA